MRKPPARRNVIDEETGRDLEESRSGYNSVKLLFDDPLFYKALSKGNEELYLNYIEDRDAIASALTFLKAKSIAQAGRDLAGKLLAGKKYESMDPAAFFSHIYNIRNNIVHRGKIDAPVLHAILGEVDRFVADLLQHHYVKPQANAPHWLGRRPRG